MKVLLLHPEDQPSTLRTDLRWDLIVDLGRAPRAAYEQWGRINDCRVVSLYDFSRGFEDLYRIHGLFLAAAGIVVDDQGIDWFDVLSPMLLSDIETAVLYFHLGEQIGNDCQLYSSRPSPHTEALQKFLGVNCTYLQKSVSSVVHTVRHYKGVLSKLSLKQLAQIAQDKFDNDHAIRRRFAHRRPSTGNQVFLLPSAYINVSRTAISYASLLPEEQFLLMTARRDGELKSLPANVRTGSLDGYFSRPDDREEQFLLQKWGALQKRLVANKPEFSLAGNLGMFDRLPSLMHWGLAIRDAWNRVFRSENIVGCLSADDSNPYTSIPLYVAKNRHVPTLAVHHGALDYRMSVKKLQADTYLAKGEMERDFLLHMCRVSPERIVTGAPGRPSAKKLISEDRPWLVFFTEPYGSAGWRMDEVYRDLLPKLFSLAQSLELKLVFKLHPYESIKGHRNLLRKYLSRGELGKTGIIAGPATEELWQKIRFAMTVESTISLECASREVPVFLCSWLQTAHSGYVQQYAKYGVGHILNSADQIADIPDLLKGARHCAIDLSKIWQAITPRELCNLLTGVREPPARALA